MATSYAEDAFFNGQDLKESLNRQSEIVEASYRHNLTPLATFVIMGSSERERFDTQIDRNSNTGRVSAGFELGQFALIRGRAFVGFRSLSAADGGTLPSFRGVTANVDASYTAPSQTRLTVRATRDVQHSYDPNNPYYVQTGFGLTLTQRIIGRWDAQLTAARDRLGYRTHALDGRKDFVDRVAGGIGYQLAEHVRASFDVQSQHRTSAVEGTGYRTLRFGGSVNYGY